jgi:cytidylate kinase
MAKRVVCVSRTLGAGGEEIAHDVAARLGLRYIDDEIVALAAEEAGVTPAEIEKAEHSPPLVTRILEALATAPVVTEGGFVAAPPDRQALPASHLIEHVIRETAEAGDVVIVAHGASHPLAHMAGVLRVLITASPEVRADRLLRDDGLDATAARKAVDASDRERAKYLERFYKVREELPTQYDLTINTDNVDAGIAVSIIAAAAIE